MAFLLNLTWILPAIIMVVLMLIPKDNKAAIRKLSVLGAIANLIIVAVLTGVFVSDPVLPAADATATELAFVTKVMWFESLGVQFYTGADGFSLLMMLMASVIALCGILVSWRIEERCKEFFVLLYLLLAGTYGCFISFDLFTFFLFNELTLIPTYLLIGIFGSGQKEFAAMKLNLMLFGGSALIILGMAAMYVSSAETGGQYHFDLIQMASQQQIPVSVQYWAFPALFLGFAILSSVFPFHSWSPAGHAAAPTAISMFLAGVHMKLGGYGCLRVGMYAMPAGAHASMDIFLVLATIGVFAGALVAIRHRDLKFINAYSSISHVGLVIFGFATFSALAIRGSVMQMVSHGFVTALVFALIGSIYSRTHTRNVDEMGGLMKQVPFLSVAFVMAGFAVVGMPGTSSFAAELTIFLGSFRGAEGGLNPNALVVFCAVLCVLTIVTTAVYVLRTVNKVVHGPLQQSYDFADADVIEKSAIVLLLFCIFAMGIFPGWIAELIDASLTPIMNVLRGGAA